MTQISESSCKCLSGLDQIESGDVLTMGRFTQEQKQISNAPDADFLEQVEEVHNMGNDYRHIGVFDRRHILLRRTKKSVANAS